MAPGRYLRASELAKRTGLSSRYFLRLAHSGKIRWATQPGGPSGATLFEETGFEAWLEAGRLERFERPFHEPVRHSRRRSAQSDLRERLLAKMAEINAQIRADRKRDR